MIFFHRINDHLFPAGNAKNITPLSHPFVQNILTLPHQTLVMTLNLINHRKCDKSYEET